MLLCTTSRAFPRAFRTSSRLTVGAEVHVGDVRATGRPGPLARLSSPAPDTHPAHRPRSPRRGAAAACARSLGGEEAPRGRGRPGLAARLNASVQGRGRRGVPGPGTARAGLEAQRPNPKWRVLWGPGRGQTTQPLLPRTGHAPRPQPSKSKNERVNEERMRQLWGKKASLWRTPNT